MYELLIRIETICMEAPLPTLLGVGAIATVAGLLLWLAGTYFSSVIIGILGAAVGSFCGLLISQWFDVSSLVSMGIGAVALCAAAVLLRNVIIIVLAIIIFALAAGTAYSSIILGSPVQQQETEAEPDALMVSSFSQMDSTMRLSYVEEISQGYRCSTCVRETQRGIDFVSGPDRNERLADGKTRIDREYIARVQDTSGGN